ALHVADPILEHASHAEEPRDRLGVVARAIDLARVEARQLAPAPGRGPQARERAERLVVVGIEPERLLVLRRRLGVLAEAHLEHVAHPAAQLGLLARRRDGGGADREDAQEVLPLPARLVHREEREGRAAVRRVGLQRALVPRARALALAEVLLEDAPDAVGERRELLGGARALGEAREGGDRLLPL